MLPEYVEKLRQEYTGKEVLVESSLPEMVQLTGRRGRVKTITMDGRSLVQLEGVDLSWHDIELDYLKVSDDMPSKVPGDAPETEKKDVSTTGEQEIPAEKKNVEKLSRLEIARLEKEMQQPSLPDEKNVDPASE